MPLREVPRAVARARQRETAFAARTLGQATPQRAAQHQLVWRCIPSVVCGYRVTRTVTHPGMYGFYTRFSPKARRMGCLTQRKWCFGNISVLSCMLYGSCVFRSARSVAVRGYIEIQGRRSLLCPSTQPPPPGRQRHSFCVRAYTQTTAAPAPDYNTSSSSFVSVDPNPGACLQQRTNPLLPVGKDVFSLKTNPEKHSSSSLLQYHAVQKCKIVLVLMLVLQRSLHFRA